MSLFSLVVVLLIEQILPLPYRLAVYQPLTRAAGFLEARFNAGERSHGMLAWLLAVVGTVLITGAIHFSLYALSPLLAWLWTVLIVYLTMGFRQFSHCYAEVQTALRMDNVVQARRLLAPWRQGPADGLSSSDVARQAIEQAFVVAHRHIFGVLFCFVLLPGPCGALLYRLGAFLADVWGQRTDADAGDFGTFARQAFAVIDWLPQRLTAAGFAVVGNFEDAVYCWRTQAATWPVSEAGVGMGIVLASGAGALGVRLGIPMGVSGAGAEPIEFGVGEAADVDFMQSVTALIGRAMLLWLLLLLLLLLATLVAH